jgi:lipoprotein-anchoring transpeptidase ErfK/SrfK
VFSIQKKFISDTMANLGSASGGERYRIEDVPWTQYFDGSIALHGAFWHNGFGLQRSHGCVNLSPTDAHRVWNETWPVIPQGWQGVSTDHTGFHGSRVVVSE